MPHVSPYHIEHRQLDNTDTAFLSAVDKETKYCYFFWWHTIPLGHFYTDEHPCADIKKAVLDLILPALRQYSSGNDLINDAIASYSASDFPAFALAMEKIFNTSLPANVPEQVAISVVICTRNRSESLKNCLEGLMQQTCKPAEIIVVDNAPTDDSTKDIVALFDAVTYCREPRPGLDIARNTGAKTAKFPIVAYTDDDVSVDKLWVYRVWETFSKGNIDAMTGLVIASSLETESQQIFEKHWGFNRGYQDIYFDADFIYKSTVVPRVWDIGAGANMAFRKSAIEKVNYFDERLDVGAAGCSGDSEIWFRMLAAGLNIQYNPRAFVFHHHRKELKQLHKQIFNYMRGHVASLLIQDRQNKEVGYKKYLFYNLIKYYALLLRVGFPNYKFRYRTLWSEIKGYISGVRFYNKNKNKPAI